MDWFGAFQLRRNDTGMPKNVARRRHMGAGVARARRSAPGAPGLALAKRALMSSGILWRSTVFRNVVVGALGASRRRPVVAPRQEDGCGAC